MNRRGRSAGPIRLPPLPKPGQPWPVAFSFVPLTSVEYRNYDERDGKTKHSGAGLFRSWSRDSAVSRGRPAARRTVPRSIRLPPTHWVPGASPRDASVPEFAWPLVVCVG